MQHDTTNPTAERDEITIALEPESLAPGTSVEVRRRFDQAWARGFEVAATGGDGYRLRRQSDGALLPVSFPAMDVRPSSTVQLPR